MLLVSVFYYYVFQVLILGSWLRSLSGTNSTPSSIDDETALAKSLMIDVSPGPKYMSAILA